MKPGLLDRLRSKAREINRNLSALAIAFKRSDVPLPPKIVAAFAVGYALSPVDLIPDFIPVIGYLDDIVILPLLISLAIRMIPAKVMAECRERAAGLWKDGKPKRWYYAIPIVGIWLLLVFVAAKTVFFGN